MSHKPWQQACPSRVHFLVPSKNSFQDEFAEFGKLSVGSWHWSHYKSREETAILWLPKLRSAANQCFSGNNNSTNQSLLISPLLQDHITCILKDIRNKLPVVTRTRNQNELKSELHLCLIRRILTFACERSQSRFVKAFETIITLDLTCQANPLRSLNKELCCIKCPFLFWR